ncbi:MAG: M48 family metallopeptidase [Alphaproteobacteria bacterium]
MATASLLAGVLLLTVGCQTSQNSAEFDRANLAGFDEETGAALPLEEQVTGEQDVSSRAPMTSDEANTGSRSPGWQDTQWDSARYNLLPVAPNERPEPGTDEAGLWQMMDEREARLRASAALVEDPALTAYVDDLVCRVAGPYCGDTRVYLIDHPAMNASMAPNGMMVLFTGLLIRSRSESAVGSVIGHEIGHYLLRHSVLGHRRRVDMATGLMAFGIAAGSVGMGDLTNFAQILAQDAYFEHSRDQERQSDGYGYALLARAGLDPREGPELWALLLAEDNAMGEEDEMFFGRTHPLSRERLDEGRRVTQEIFDASTVPLETGQDRYLQALLPVRGELLKQQLDAGQYESFQVILDFWRETGVAMGEIEFYQGELFRLRSEANEAEGFETASSAAPQGGEHASDEMRPVDYGNDGDSDDADEKHGDTASAENDEHALKSYELALELGGYPPRLHRSMGVVLARLGRLEEARNHLETYLELAPDAPDRPLIELMMMEVTS